MTKNKTIPKSIIDQIFNKMFDLIEEEGVFNKEIIQDLKKLAYDGNLKKENLVIKVITSEGEET